MNEWMQVAMAPAPKSGSAGAPADPMAGFISLLPLILIFILFYVLFIVPQRRQQKKHEELLKALKKGDEVVTTGGIYGTIVNFNEQEDSVFLKLGENVKVEMKRGAIAGLRRPPVTPEVVKK